MIQINNQDAEDVVRRPDGVLEVVGEDKGVFFTLQGEGPFAVTPAVFVRLAGCNLQCPDCDTDYTSSRVMVPPLSLANLVDDAFPPAASAWKERLVVITGGEPFRQNVTPFVRELLLCGFKVQIETNGTLRPPDDFPTAGDVTLVVSPKVGNVHPDIKRYTKHLKYVLEAGRLSESRLLPLNVLGNRQRVELPWPDFKGTVWVQPADMQNEECNKANLEACVAAAKEHGYRVSLQQHKIMGVE